MMSDIDYKKWQYPECGLEVLEEFNGYVSEINDSRKTFWFICEDTQGGRSQIEMSCSRLPLNERPYLQEGAYCRFRLYKDPDYDGEVIEEFIFNKDTYSEEEIKEAQKKAQEIASFLNQ